MTTPNPQITDAFDNKNLARFWSSVDKNSDDGCWLWIGSKSARQGYGLFYAGRSFPAHRYSLKASGVDIPSGMYVDHICRNKSCVNPSHLRVVTPRINSIENSTGITAINAAKARCKNGHDFTPENTGRNKKGRYCKACDRIKQERVRRRKGIQTWEQRHAK